MARQVAKRENPVIRPENRVQRFLRETIAELRKVVWPTRDEAIRLTSIVIVVIIAMALFLGGIDYVLNLIVRLLLR